MRLSLPPAATGTLLAAVSVACYLNGNTLSDTISLLFATAVVCVLPAIFHLFFMHKRFLLHRLSGFLYLANFTTQCAMELYDFPLLEQYHKYLVVALAGNGCLQAIIAGFTFKFLPNTDGKVQGYYTDKRTMSRDFVLENVFFSGLLFFQATYYTFPQLFRAIPPIEASLVFFPYYVYRPLFPKTSFRASLNNDKEKSAKNKTFMNANLYFIKFFYVCAKHISGFYLNYLIFLDAIPSTHAHAMRYLFLLGGWGTTISMFLHTLKFKGFIGPRVAMLLYTGSFPLFYLAYASLWQLVWAYPSVSLLCVLGIFINFTPVPVQMAYQVLVCAVLGHQRHWFDGLVSDPQQLNVFNFSSILPLTTTSSA